MGIETRSPSMEALVQQLRAAGVLCRAVGPHSIRMVTHLDVSREDILRAAEEIRRIASR